MRIAGAAFTGALLLVSAIGVSLAQPKLAAVAHEAKEQEDVYVLPPARELKALDLGYDAATVDLLWATLVTEFGVHVVEHRDFHPDPYVDAITAVEPDYALLYRFVDTLLCFRPKRGTEADARKARAVLEGGTRARPNDYDVWLHYGQFVAFLGPSFLTDEDERERWRHDGALGMMRAVELGADAERALSAAAILSAASERDATIRALSNVYALTDDPRTRREIELKLGQLNASAEAERRAHADDADARAAQGAVQAFESRWRARYPFLSRGEFLLLGPGPDAARCAGIETARDPACATTWGDALAGASTH